MTRPENLRPLFPGKSLFAWNFPLRKKFFSPPLPAALKLFAIPFTRGALMRRLDRGAGAACLRAWGNVPRALGRLGTPPYGH